MAKKGEGFVCAVEFDESFVGKMKKPAKMTDNKWEEPNIKALSTIRLKLVDDVIYDVMEEDSRAGF